MMIEHAFENWIEERAREMRAAGASTLEVAFAIHKMRHARDGTGPCVVDLGRGVRALVPQRSNWVVNPYGHD